MQKSIKTLGFGLMLSAALSLAACTTETKVTEITMYKNANCDCCGAWAKHMRNAGFVVIEEPREDMTAIKEKYGVFEKLASCHTAIVDGYVIEGHVPADDVKRLLKEHPDVVGLTAPGMPMKSPGMQTAKKKPQGYDVLSFNKEGNVAVYKRYGVQIHD